MTQFGSVAVRRLAYRAPGQPNLHPRDGLLNLPLRRYSWQVQQAVVRYVLAGAYEQARQFLLAASGIKIGKQRWCASYAPMPHRVGWLNVTLVP